MNLETSINSTFKSSLIQYTHNTWLLYTYHGVGCKMQFLTSWVKMFVEMT